MSDNVNTRPPMDSGVRPKILVVEDEFLIRLTLTEVLSDEGYDVLEAERGTDALEIIAAERGIAVLLTDVQLPGGMDGHVVAKRARELIPTLPIIFMTGADTAGGQARGPRDLYLAKPYLPAEMCAAVRTMLNL